MCFPIHTMSVIPSGDLVQLFPQHAADSFFQGDITVMNVFAQSIIDHGLVVASPGSIDPVAKPGKYVIVYADCDASLSRRSRVQYPLFRSVPKQYRELWGSKSLFLQVKFFRIRQPSFVVWPPRQSPLPGFDDCRPLGRYLKSDCGTERPFPPRWSRPSGNPRKVQD